MLKFIKSLFRKRATEPAAPPVKVDIPSYARHSTSTNPRYGTAAPSRIYAESSASFRSQSSGEDFGTSMAVAAMTNSTALGVLVGGSLTGAVLGDMLREDTPSRSSADYGSSSGSDWGSSSSSDSGSCSSSDSGGSWD